MPKRKSIRAVLGLAAAAAGALAAGVSDAQLFTSEKEIMRQSRVEWLSLKRHTPLAPNERTQRYVECVAYSIIDVLPGEYRNLDWEVVVFDNDALNAFAMPGGKIGVFTGIFRVADTPEKLAAVLGHEVAHLTEDHVMDRARRQKRTDALVLLGGAVTGAPGVTRDAGTIVRTLPFAREQESEADRVGLDYMASAGYDPRASLLLWKNMSAARDGRRVAEFLSTHPADDIRMDNLVKAYVPSLTVYNEAREAGQRPSCSP